MGVVEDVRQIIQDFLAPELRAIIARLDAQDKVADARYKEQQLIAEARQKEIDSRFSAIDSRFDALDPRFEAIESRSESRFNQLVLRIQSLQETVERNDSAQRLLIAKLTQDFEFDKRLTELERERRSSKSPAA
jgi:DNA repair exonuclease SbcCD ATPase subunit